MSHNERQIAIMLLVAFISGFFGVLAFVQTYLARKNKREKTVTVGASGTAPRKPEEKSSEKAANDGVYDYTPHELTDKVYTGCLLVAIMLFLAGWAFRRLGLI